MERQSKRLYLFNCDNTCKLEPVETLLLQMEEKHNLKIVVEKLYFGLQRMSEICETTIPQLKMDYAVFVIHAEESRLSINEENAGIGYARFYRALLSATGDKVLIVIAEDQHYRDENEEQQSVISRWARRKVASQFDDEYLDGRKSFIFSWNIKHRAIHEEALLHYFDPNKKGQKFQYQPKPKPAQELQQPKVTAPVVATRTQRKFGVEDDNAILLANDELDDEHQGISNNDEGQRSYGGTDIISAPVDYPEGTLLLETRLHCGIISFEENDVVVWHQRWQPSEKAVQDLGREWKSIRVAQVKFIANDAGGVNCHVFKVKESCCQRCNHCMKKCGLSTYNCLKSCTLGMYNCLKSCTLGMYNCLKSCTLGIYNRMKACA